MATTLIFDTECLLWHFLEAFEEDFRSLSWTLTSNVLQVYGYNKSRIPSLVLYNELVPVAHLKGKIGLLGQMYLFGLGRQLGCKSNGELWMDIGRGVICRGPPESDLDLHIWDLGIKNLPLTMELIQGDVLLRFLASFKSKEVDRAVVVGVSYSGTGAWQLERVSRPTVISTLTDSPIALADNAWKSYNDSLSGRNVLENRLTRFTPADRIHLRSGGDWDIRKAWMAQALNVFHAHGITLEDDLSIYELTYPTTRLKGHLSNSKAKQRSRQQIYLFVRPHPPDLDDKRCYTSSLHHWSFDEEGHSPLPHGVCHDFGLPIKLRFINEYNTSRWFTDHYKLVHQYQHLRGFDPTTTDFARHLGYQDIFQIARTNVRC
ncbi:hypothetical protein PQX77_019451 [Marasmius sp. AFHP31]|nr:hypothetical protein PQX77_019451 [Marasmius sp. AFHP31]